MKSIRTIGVTTATVLALSLTACGGNDSTEDPSVSDIPTAAVASDATSSDAGAATSDGMTDLAAVLTWPQGTDDFVINLCASVGENTILGAGENDEWSLNFDANLLESGDTGILTVSTKSDMAVEYSADVTSLTVNPDGSFTGSGQDASQAPFTITGTCIVSW